MNVSRMSIAGKAIVFSLVASFCLSSPEANAAEPAMEAAAQVSKANSPSVSSTAFGAGKRIPQKYTGDGADLSPPLSWSAPPAGTKSFALSCEDPDAPRGTWWHWIIVNIPPGARSLAENIAKTEKLKDGSRQGKNDFGKTGYNGPSPPPGATHHYHFKLVALDKMLDVSQGFGKREYAQAIKGHVLGEGELTGTYSR